MRTAVASALTPAITTPPRRFGPSPPLPKVEPPRRGLPLFQVALAIIVAVAGFLIYEKSKAPREIAAGTENTAPAAPVAPTPPKSDEPKPVPSKDVVSLAPKTEPAPVAAVPATRVPAPMAPQSATAKWIAEQEPKWQAAYAAEVSGLFEKDLASLKQQYLANLEKQLAAFFKAAKLDEAVAFRAERDRMAAGGEVPAEDEATTPAALKTVRASYRSSLAKLDTERLAKAKSVHARYDTVLAQNQTLLTQKHRFDEALEMKAKREALSAAWLPPPAGVPAPTPAMSEVESQALASLAESSVRNPGDTTLALKVATLQLWFGRSADYAATCERMLKWVAGTDNASSADRAAKIASLSPDVDLRARKTALAVSRRAVELDQKSNLLPYHMMVLGMAEYRSGLYGEADGTLSSAIQTAATTGDDSKYITGTAGYFRAMILFKQGKLAEAHEVFASTEARMKSIPTELKPAFSEAHDDLIVWLAYRGAKALLYPPSPDGWEDLLARLTPALLKQTGPGWRIETGTLSGPDAERAILPLPGTFSGTSYQFRVNLRQLTAAHGFHLILPVGDQMTMLDLDGFEGQFTGLSTVDGKAGKDLPGVVEGKQVKDSESHNLEVMVRLNGANARITTTLDARPLYEWTGPIAILGADPRNGTRLQSAASPSAHRRIIG